VFANRLFINMKNTVSIFISNHVKTFVSDQLDFLTYSLNNNGIDCVQSEELRKDVPNILIENFTMHDVTAIEKFKKKYNDVDLFCVITEHFEVSDGGLLLNDEPFDSPRSYIPNLYERFINFFRLSTSFSGLIVLNNSPDKQKIQEILPTHKIFSFDGFPVPSCITKPLADSIKKEYDLCFFGTPTNHRLAIIKELKQAFNIYSDFGVTPKDRDKIIKQSHFNINIAQSESWINISPMRVFSSSKLGVWTINLSSVLKHNLPGVIDMQLPELIKNGLPTQTTISNFPDYDDTKYKNNVPSLDGFDLWIT